MSRMIVGLVSYLWLGLAAAADRPDIVVADFESDDYGRWTTEGTAFGAGPARGTLPNQMPVDRGSIEVFGTDGQVALSVGVLVPVDNHELAVSATGGPASFRSLVVHVLRLAWRESP